MSSRRRISVKRQSEPCTDPSCAASSSTRESTATAITTLLTSGSVPPTSSSSHPTSSTTQPASPTASTPASSSSSSSSPSSSNNAGTIAGSVVGAVVFLALLVLAAVLYLRARKRRRTPPSSEFINSIRDGAAPVLRLDSGAEYTPALAEKSGHTHHPPTIPVPFLQNSYYLSPPTQNIKFPDEMMTDVPSQRPSVEKPHHPQRLSSQQGHDPFVTGTSVGSKREFLGNETEMASVQLSPGFLSLPRADSVLQFAPRFSLDEPLSQTIRLSQSPTSLQPLRRQPD